MKSAKGFPIVPRSSALKSLAKFVKNPIPTLMGFLKEHGDTFYMYVGGVQKGLITTNAEVVKSVFQKQHRKFEKSKLQTETVAKYTGKGLLTNTGEDWLRQRRLIQPGFHKEKIEKLMTLMMSVIQPFSEKLAAFPNDKKLNVSELMFELSFEIITRTLISRPIPEEELKEMSQAISDVQGFIVKQVRLPFLAPIFYLTGKVQKNVKRTQKIRKQLLAYVNERRMHPTKDHDLLNMLLESRYEDTGEPMTDERLLDEMLILFIAGHETTANALAWTWYLLDQHPMAVDKIREEAAGFFDEKITLESIRKLEYTGRVVNESMRMYPPAWITDRIALEDTELLSDHLKKGDTVLPFIYGLHRNPAYWPNPDIFDPDRFSPEAIAERPKFAYLPFGAGPRFCIGNNFALIEMQLTIAYLCSKLDFKKSDDQSIEILPMVTLRMDRDLEMYCTPRVEIKN